MGRGRRAVYFSSRAVNTACGLVEGTPVDKLGFLLTQPPVNGLRPWQFRGAWTASKPGCPRRLPRLLCSEMGFLLSAVPPLRRLFQTEKWLTAAPTPPGVS